MNIFFIVLNQWDFAWRRPFSAFVRMKGALKMKITSGEVDDSSQSNATEISKETVVLRRWEI